MSQCRRWCLVTLGLLAAVLASGCISSRAAYFRDLHQRRARAYRRWRQEDPEVNRPRLDGELSLEEALDTHELIKVRLHEPDDKKRDARLLAERTEAALCGLIGHTVILYRPHPDEPKITLGAA